MPKLIPFSILLVLFLCTSSAWAQDHPTAEALYRQFDSAPKHHTRSYFQFANKSGDFISGAREVIEAMKQNRDCQTTFAGFPAKPPPYIDSEFGIPMRALGCVPDTGESAQSLGRRAALLWYAERGKYPINSTKPRLPLAKVPQTEWLHLEVNGDTTDTKLPALQGLSLRLTYHNGSSSLSFNVPGGKAVQVLYWQWKVPADQILWTYDKSTATVWLDVPSPGYLPRIVQTFRPLNTSRQNLYEMDSAMKAFSWAPLKLADTNSLKNDEYVSVFMSDAKVSAKSVVMVRYQLDGHNYDENWDDATVSWLKCSWAYDKATGRFFIDKGEPVKLFREFLQFDPKSGDLEQTRDAAGNPI